MAIEMTVWKTSDGSAFTSQTEAEAHEAMSDFIVHLPLKTRKALSNVITAWEMYRAGAAPEIFSSLLPKPRAPRAKKEGQATSPTKRTRKA